MSPDIEVQPKPEHRVKLNVIFYDAEEEKAFQESDKESYSKLKPLTDSGISIDRNEFIANGLFIEQKDGPRWDKRVSLKQIVPRRISFFEDYFDYDASLTAKEDDVPTYLTELVGAAGAISVMDQAFGTHAADWQKIPISQEKDLDFQVASTGQRLVAVEAKGTMVEKTSLKSTNTSKYKNHIKEKKQQQQSSRAGVLVGTITAYSKNKDDTAVVWLVDPPYSPIEDPLRHKIVSRYRFYYKLISFVGQPRMLISLINRIKVIESVTNLSDIEGLALVDMVGYPQKSPSFTQNKSYALSGRVAGVIEWVESLDNMVFVGMDTDVIEVVLMQSFALMSRWSSNLYGRRMLAVSALIDRSTAINLGIFRGGREVGRYELEFDCFITKAGVVYGHFSGKRPIRHKRGRNTYNDQRLFEYEHVSDDGLPYDDDVEPYTDDDIPF